MITSGVEFGSDCPPEEYRTIDPMVLLRRWLPPADAAPALMALSTLGRDGYPRVRHVLLSDADDAAVYFHTDSRSSKVAELAELPRAGIAVAWPQRGRQVVAHGIVRRPAEDSLRETFSRRTRYLQLLAWCNDHEMSALPTHGRHRRWAEFDATHPTLSPPDTWTGFAIDIREIAFWRGDPDGPSQRVRFTRTDHSWTSEVLPRMTATTFHNALILPVAGDKPWFRGWLTADAGGRISGIGEGAPPADAPGVRHDLEGCFLAPGFVSGHSHIYTGGMRGVAADSPLYEWVSRNSLMLLGADADDLYWMTLAGGLDHLSSGITSVYNFTQSRVIALFDYEKSVLRAERIHPAEFVNRQVDGLAASGIRFVTSVRLDDEQLAEDEAFHGFDEVMRHLATVDPALNLGGSVYGSVQWSSAPVTAERERALMDRYGITNQAHFVETAEQIDIQQAKFDWYDAAGVLGPDFAFGHFVHPTDRMVARARDTGSSVVWQPMSNGRLGSGIADIPRLLSDAVTVGMGVDDQSCTDVSDPFENMRTGLFLQRGLRSDAAVLSPADVLALHTIGSATAIGVADRVGSLEVGKYADLVVVDPYSPHTGPIWDPVATYVLGCGLRNLREVFVGGRSVWARGVSDPMRSEADLELTERMIRSAARSGIRPAVSPPADRARTLAIRSR